MSILSGATMVATCLGSVIGRASEFNLRSTLGPRQQATLLAALIITSGIAWGVFVEGWGVVDSFYWSVVSCTSVGYGDLVPSATSRVVGGLLLLSAVGCFAGSAAALVKAQVDAEVARQVEAFVARGVSERLIEEIDGDGDGRVERMEFTKYMLVKEGKVEERDVAKLDALFDALDTDGSGHIDAADIIRHTSKARPLEREEGSSDDVEATGEASCDEGSAMLAPSGRSRKAAWRSSPR